jgi:hypothetical protein
MDPIQEITPRNTLHGTASRGPLLGETVYGVPSRDPPHWTPTMTATGSPVGGALWGIPVSSPLYGFSRRGSIVVCPMYGICRGAPQWDPVRCPLEVLSGGGILEGVTWRGSLGRSPREGVPRRGPMEGVPWKESRLGVSWVLGMPRRRGQIEGSLGGCPLDVAWWGSPGESRGGGPV